MRPRLVDEGWRRDSGVNRRLYRGLSETGRRAHGTWIARHELTRPVLSRVVAVKDLQETSGQRGARRAVALQRAGAVRLLEADPDLSRHLTSDESARLRRHVLAEVGTLERGRWNPLAEDFGGRPLFGVLVLDGALVRRVTVGQRHGAELLGEGDLIRPHQEDADGYASVAQTAEWSVLAPARLAVLDHDLIAGLAGVDGVLPELAARALNRSRALALRLAITQIPNLAKRLHLMLWHLADRWGRQEDGCVTLGLRLPQDLLADLLSAQRTSVNAALAELVGQGAIENRDGTWALCGDPPVSCAEESNGRVTVGLPTPHRS
jgi:CRP/FNR family transcriptional regulator, cyclic AMP receptor protein